MDKENNESRPQGISNTGKERTSKRPRIQRPITPVNPKPLEENNRYPDDLEININGDPKTHSMPGDSAETGFDEMGDIEEN